MARPVGQVFSWRMFVSSRPIVCCLLAMLPWLTATVRAQSVDNLDPQALIQLEHAWNEAFYNKDISFIEQILAEEFIATYEDGTQGDKAKELALIKEFNQRVESANQDDFLVRLYGDTAIVWFTLHLTGPRQGQTVQVDLRYVDVFVWRRNRWQCVSSHSTRIAKP